MLLTPAGIAHVHGARGALRLGGGRHNNVGVSLRKRRATMQVMFGVSLRARWDAILVIAMNHCRWTLFSDILVRDVVYWYRATGPRLVTYAQKPAPVFSRAESM